MIGHLRVPWGGIQMLAGIAGVVTGGAVVVVDQSGFLFAGAGFGFATLGLVVTIGIYIDDYELFRHGSDLERRGGQRRPRVTYLGAISYWLLTVVAGVMTVLGIVTSPIWLGVFAAITGLIWTLAGWIRFRS